MLTIPRKMGERIVIGEDIVLTVIAIQGDKVRFRLERPDGTRVHRQGSGGRSATSWALTRQPVPPPTSRSTR